MEILKIGVIGIGHIGRNHVRNLSDDKRFDFAGVYDSNPMQVQKIAAKYTVKAYDDENALLDWIFRLNRVFL